MSAGLTSFGGIDWWLYLRTGDDMYGVGDASVREREMDTVFLHYERLHGLKVHRYF